MEQQTVTLAPDRGLAALWTGLGGVATGLAAYSFGASGMSLLIGIVVVLCSAVTAVHALQLMAPATWTAVVDREGVRGTLGTIEVDHRFAGLRAVEVGRLFGDPTLVLVAASGRRVLLLPVGCDLTALRRLLAELERDASRVSSGRTAEAVEPDAS